MYYCIQVIIPIYKQTKSFSNYMISNINDKRIVYIDLVKGFLILLLLLSHSIPKEDILKTWIFSFHMPIFFYICGIITRIKLIKHPINIENHLKSRMRNLIIPYFAFGFLLIGFYTFLDYYSTESISFIGHRIYSLICLHGIDSLWFIPIYFFSELVFSLIITRKRIYTVILLCVCLILIYFPINLIPQIKQISIGLIFILT